LARTQTHFDLIDACRQQGCPVCRVTLVAVARCIDRIDYEFVNDPAIRAAVERTWGFCGTHAQQWLREGHVLGVALVYEGVIARLHPQVEQTRPEARPDVLSQLAARFRRRRRGTDRALPRPQGRCPVCRERDETESRLIVALGEGLRETADDFRVAFRQSDGLCLPHLRLAFSILGDAETGDALRGATVAHQERLLGQLREIVRKHDYRYRDEPSGEERGAATRAVAHVTGLPGIGARRP
jgi:hypothetical protein